ncbi:MAG TPA: SGNH/GDSL hydrolase family protein, partial [Bacteroidota bacterium]|nr:SGNH/GDSL hydrolase family protein [Bacteroidota bacterium]
MGQMSLGFVDVMRKNFRLSQFNLTMLLLALGVVCSNFARAQTGSSVAGRWVGTWSTAPQLVETTNNPPAPGLSNNTLRQVVHVSIGGDSVRVRFTNEFSTSPVKLNSVHVALSAGGGTIDTTTDRVIYFNGQPDALLAPG